MMNLITSARLFLPTEITKVWDSVSECYHQDLLLKKVGLLSSWSSLKTMGVS